MPVRDECIRMAGEEARIICAALYYSLKAEGEDASVARLNALKYNPRGMTITDISKKTGYPPDPTGKQPEILHGRREGRGPANRFSECFDGVQWYSWEVWFRYL